jgi:hypothetical protein
MLKIRPHPWNIVLVLYVLLMSGCNTEEYQPQYWHKNFVAILQSNVGMQFKSVREGKTGGWAWDRNLVDRTELPTSNIAYKYRSQRTCRYTLEVDPKTDIIVATSWEGNERDCAIVP